MRVLLLITCLCFTPSLALAQLVIQQGKPVSDAAANDTSIAPIANDDGTGPVEAVIQGTNFPAKAITPVGPTPAGRSSVEPVNVAKRKIITNDNPLWPTDTVDIFVSACSSMRPQLMPLCSCVIEKLAVNMKHNEFIALSEVNAVEQDPRYLAAREACVPRDAVAK